ncbi:MAG: Asp-tRNA(Asn)/Glu-tRNA(Gln) amidotransferase GatCAB subunit B, partial [Actinobacteria bacterium]|nr:Asp-tRNA(Asn)/Glu-tRNA(Gln) amidotransferase GatCAB subunit B [Actinomycetota bacterium]
PDARKRRFVEEYGLPPYDAGVLTSSRALAGFFEESVGLYPDPKTVSNWVMGEVLRVLNARNEDIASARITPRALAGLLKMIEGGAISGKIGKSVIEEMVAAGRPAEEIVKEKGLLQISDESELARVVARVVADNPGPAGEFRAGKEKALGFLVGQVMKLTGGRANPGLVNRLLKEELSGPHPA